ncbi:glycosyltransferase [Alphaproteobacteria bacterium]|nr:glycosyltransferase [Alphaproteobacteria bacterium]
MIVMHIIIGLDIGGAELMLKRLVEYQTEKSLCQHHVVSLTGIGKLGLLLQKKGVKVDALNMKGFFDIPRVFINLQRIIRNHQPDIVQTWLYHSDFLGGLAAFTLKKRRIIWGIRGTDIPQSHFSTTGLLILFSSILSRFIPTKIVCCAESARIAHIKKGYYKKKMIVIPNGYNLNNFNNSPELKKKARAAFGFAHNDIIIGIVARYDPLKDYKNFINAATIVAKNVKNAKIFMIGHGVDLSNSFFKSLLNKNGVADKFLLVGQQEDIPFCLAAMDIFCLSSKKEGFPNVVCEAMAMKIPCLVTDAGAASEIVGKTGIVVAPKDSIILAKALETMIKKGEMERNRLGELARLRIAENYSIEIVSNQYEKLYRLEMSK